MSCKPLESAQGQVNVYNGVASITLRTWLGHSEVGGRESSMSQLFSSRDSAS